MSVRPYLLAIIAFVSGGLLMTGVFTVDAAQGCTASASIVWKADVTRTYRAEAFSSGPTCLLAVATLVVRAPGGKAIWADARAADTVMTLARLRTRSKMTRALGEWLAQDDQFKSTANLPEWKKGADAPSSGEFPFYPEDGTDRDAYEKLRTERQPMFCYVQGMESMACLGLAKDGSLNKIGVQLFPG